MRLATITNWAYGATVALTLVSGMTMLRASAAQDRERASVEQRYRLDQATSQLGTDMLALTEQARGYVISGDPTHLDVYRREQKALGSIETRIAGLRDTGATSDELAALKEAIRWADGLHDEQGAALAARARGDLDSAREIMFGAEYEREVDRIEALIERFQYRLDQRTTNDVATATGVARLWKTISEVTLGTTGLLFLCVLYFIFKRRVLRPVVRLSDVVNRLAAQDYAVELPQYEQIDEIGDMTQAIRLFRENGMERLRLEEERNVDRTARDILSRMTQRMQGCATVLDLKEVVQCFMPEIAPRLAGRLYLLDPSRQSLVELCSWLSPAHSRESFSPIACWALRRGVPHRPNGEAIDVPCDHLALADGATIDSICLPLTAQRETLGLLYLEPRSDASLNSRVLDTYLLMLSENIGLALANLHLRDTLRDMAMADPLTGLANRRQLETTLEAQLAQSERHGKPLSCLMLDVDHFKLFNDRYGHDSGDAVLREVGTILHALTRDHGLAFRYGGEEFLLLLPDLGPEQAMARAEEIRSRIAALRVVHEGIELGAVTASIGLASTPAHCLPERLVQGADAALLRAKSLGRNRVEMAVARRRDKVA